MSITGPAEVFDTAHGGFFQQPEEAGGFHKELQGIQDEAIKQKQGDGNPGAGPVVGGIANALIEGILGNGNDAGVAKKLMEKIRPPVETVYSNDLEPSTTRRLSTQDKLVVSEKGHVSLYMPDGASLSFGNGEVAFNSGQNAVRQTTRDGITTLQFNNGDTVKYNQDGLLKIHRGQDRVVFMDKKAEPPAPVRLEKAIDKLDDNLSKEESAAVRDLASALVKGNVDAVSAVARQFYKNPEAMNRVVNTLNAALQAAEIPRIKLNYDSSLDNRGNRTGTLNVNLSHGDNKLSPTTNFQFHIANGQESMSATYKNFYLKPSSAGSTFQQHIENPAASNYD